MTTVTNLIAATPGNGSTGPAQGAGSAAAGFEALLAAFFGEPATLAPVQGASNVMGPMATAPVIVDGEVLLTGEAVEVPLVADVLNLAGGEGDAETADQGEDQAQAMVDPTLLVDAAAIVTPQAAPVVTAPVVNTPAVSAPAVTQDATTTDMPTTVKPAAPQTVVAQPTPNAVAAQAVTTDAVATEAVATEAVAAGAAAEQAVPAPRTEAPAHGLAKGKSNAAPTARAAVPAHASAPAPADTKAAADAPVVEGEAELPSDTQVAKAPIAPQAPQAETAKAAPAPRASQPAQAAAAAPAAPTVNVDPVEAAAVVAVATEAAASEAATEASPALTGAADDVTTAMAGRMAAAAQRPRDGKADAQPQPGKAETKTTAAATAASPATGKAAGTKPGPQAKPEATETASRKEPETEVKTAAAPAHHDETHGVAHEERHAEAARGPNATSSAQHAMRGSPETVANLAAQIVKKLNGKTTRFDVELTPHGMGQVDVRIEIQNGRVTAAMVFDNPQAAAELKARAAELQRSLEQAGFDLSGGLSFEARDGGEAGRGWRQAQDQNEGRGMRGQAFQNAFETAAEAADVAESGALRLRRGVNTSGLDVRV